MIVSCPACGVRYVSDHPVPTAGRVFRCSACGHSWRLYDSAPVAAPPVALAPAVAPSVIDSQTVEVPQPIEEQVSPLWLGAAALVIVAGLLTGAAFLMRGHALVAAPTAAVVPLYKLIVDGPQAQAQLRLPVIERITSDNKPTLLLKAELSVSEPTPLPILRLTLLDASGNVLAERDYADYLNAPPPPGIPQVFRVSWSEPPVDARDVRVTLVPPAAPPAAASADDASKAAPPLEAPALPPASVPPNATQNATQNPTQNAPLITPAAPAH